MCCTRQTGERRTHDFFHPLMKSVRIRHKTDCNVHSMCQKGECLYRKSQFCKKNNNKKKAYTEHFGEILDQAYAKSESIIPSRFTSFSKFQQFFVEGLVFAPAPVPFKAFTKSIGNVRHFLKIQEIPGNGLVLFFFYIFSFNLIDQLIFLTGFFSE